MDILYIDFETRSPTAIALGAYVYSLDIRTEIMCMAYRFNKEPIEICLWGELPERIRIHAEQGGQIRAFNASFERLIWNNVAVNKYGWPKTEIKQYRCIKAHAHTHRIVGNLEMTGRFLGIGGKDQEGSKSLTKLYAPIKTKDGSLKWHENQTDFDLMLRYCKRDVELMCDIESRMFPWPQSEIELYWLNEEINDRGIRVNAEICKAAIAEWDVLKNEAKEEITKLTGGRLTSPNQAVAMVKYINDVVKPEVPYTSSTEFKEEDFEGDVKRVVQLRKRFAKSATSKFSKFLEMSCADGRYRGAHIYHGAGTGRFSGYGAQVQNMPRPVNKLPEIIKARQYLLDPWGHDRPAAMETLLSDCIRGVLIPSDGKVMTAIDFAGIELRVLAWLAGAQTKLNMIRSGRDLYRQMASEIYSKPYEEILKESFERQVGKTGELALGFQGGKGALAKGLKLSGISMTEDEMKKVIKAYREALYNTEIVKFWDSLQKAAIKAVRNPMTSCKAGDHLTFVKVANWLICQLPSKDAQGKRRCIYYPFPEIKYQSWYEKYDPETEETTCRSFFEDPGYPWELKSKGEVVTFRCLLRKGIVTNAAYGGFLAENATQAVARDCMTETMKKIAKMKTNVEEIAYEW